MLIEIEETEVFGTGSHLWGLIYVDPKDPENTSMEIWRANDIEDLEEQVLKLHLGEDDGEDDEEVDAVSGQWLINTIKEKFEEDWGIRILPKYIGEIK